MMSRFSFLYYSLLLALAACSTGKQVQSLKPSPDYSKELVYEKQISYLQLPVEITIRDVQNQANKYLTGLIYEDSNLKDDNLELKVWKEAPVLISEAGGRLHLELPLKVWTKVRYGVEKLGISAYDTRELHLNGTVKLHSAVSFSDWKVSTVTEVEDIKWKESPSVVVFGKSMPVTYLINPAIGIFKDEIGKVIDESIAKSIDIKPHVLAAFEAVCKPIQVNEEYNTWLGVQPLELYSTKAILTGGKIKMNLGMKAYLETSVGSMPALRFDKNKLVLRAVEKMPADFNASIAGFATYENAGALIRKNFEGEKFESGKRSVTITNVNLWGKDGKMVIELGMKGSVNGVFYLSGLPKYDALKREVYMDQLDFVLDSKNRLLKMGDWLAHSLIAKKIGENCRFSIAEQLKEGEKAVRGYLNNYEPVKGVKINGTISQLAPSKVFLTPGAIVAMVVAKGRMGVSINGM